MYVCVYVCTFLFVVLCVCMCTRVYISLCVRAHMCACMSVSVCALDAGSEHQDKKGKLWAQDWELLKSQSSGEILKGSSEASLPSPGL